MFAKYQHKKIESKWQKAWAAKGLYKTPDKAPGKKNYYLLTEFPYPSGNLHVGHWYAFALPDIAARAQRMKGKNVLYPVGFDAFGLPAENAAIKRGLNPRKWTRANIAYMKKQMASMGASFDWSREVATYDPAYYKWTQWMFIQFFKRGLAYRKETPVNWCPKDKTVLANEQVVDGKCERCDSVVERRNMLQWNLRITDYAERLINDLDPLDWPQQIKDSQKNWIGKSEGAEILFPLELPKEAGWNKKKFVLLHGFLGKPQDYDWLKGELEKLGHKVIVPTLPNSSAPTEKEWVAAALDATQYDENTVLLGYSLGAVTALKILEKIDGKVGGLVLAGGFIDTQFIDRPRNFVKTFTWSFDAAAIKGKVGYIHLLHDTTDTAISRGQAERLGIHLGTPITYVTATKPHFCGEKEPTILNYLVPSIKVFTTRPDTLFGATYTVLAPEHEWVRLALTHRGLLANEKEVQEYVTATKMKSDLERQENKEKTGVELEGVSAINPATGEKIAVFIADYVLAQYGTGAIMAVPAHDERDFAFAKKFGLPIRAVIGGSDLIIVDGDKEAAARVRDEYTSGYRCWTGDGHLRDSGEYTGMLSSEVRDQMTEKFGQKKVTYKLRDWIVSRQRYWGVPIPMIHCSACAFRDPSGQGIVPVPDKDLPVKLPEIKDYLPSGDGKSPLAKADKWKKVRCPQCNGWAERETDTLDTFVDSSWYYLRYTDPANKKQFADKQKMKSWMPVDLYSGGAEHTTMHLLYSRFWHKALYDLKLVADKEPYVRRMNRGLILGPDGAKMSKSKGNVIDPDSIVKELGADTVRMYLAFIGPFNEPGSYPWNPDGVMGVRRFIDRVWKLQGNIITKPDVLGETVSPKDKRGRNSFSQETERLLHHTIKKVGEDLEALKFNTAISSMMIFINAAEKTGLTKHQYATFLQLLAPFAPHITEELWSVLKMKDSVHVSKWPTFKAKLLVADTLTFAVQINGKLRGQITAPATATEAEVRALAESDEKVRNHLSGEISKVIFVPGKLISFVVRS